MLNKIFNKGPSDFEILVSKINEIYSYLAIAKSNQEVVIKFSDKLSKEALIVRIAGHMHLNSANPISELREFHNVLALNIKQNREIVITLE
jgi:hypothetical protein